MQLRLSVLASVPGRAACKSTALILARLQKARGFGAGTAVRAIPRSAPCRDCLASQSRGSLDEYERQVAAVEELQSISTAVRRLYPDCVNPESVPAATATPSQTAAPLPDHRPRSAAGAGRRVTIGAGFSLAARARRPCLERFASSAAGSCRSCLILSDFAFGRGRYGSQTGPPTLYVNQSESDSKQNCDFLAMVRFGPGEKSLEKPN